FTTDVSQSPQSIPNGIDATTTTPAATHHDRRQTPNSANGPRLGLSTTNTDGQAHSTPSASAATHQMTGLPVHVLRSVVGQATQSAISGHDTGRGRRRHTAKPTATIGSTHHSAAATGNGSSANGTNSQSAT